MSLSCKVCGQKCYRSLERSGISAPVSCPPTGTVGFGSLAADYWRPAVTSVPPLRHDAAPPPPLPALYEPPQVPTPGLPVVTGSPALEKTAYRVPVWQRCLVKECTLWSTIQNKIIKFIHCKKIFKTKLSIYVCYCINYVCSKHSFKVKSHQKGWWD